MSNVPDSCKDPAIDLPWDEQEHLCPECGAELDIDKPDRWTVDVMCPECGYEEHWEQRDD